MTFEIRPLESAIYEIRYDKENILQQKIPLTFIQYKMILFLYQRGEMVSNRLQIKANCFEHQISLRCIDIHKKRICEKFDKNVIESVHGEGYRLRMRYFSLVIPGYKKEEN